VITKAVKPIIPPKAVVQKQAGGFAGTVDTKGQ
jgi:hypothetical protein